MALVGGGNEAAVEVAADLVIDTALAVEQGFDFVVEAVNAAAGMLKPEPVVVWQRAEIMLVELL